MICPQSVVVYILISVPIYDKSALCRLPLEFQPQGPLPQKKLF